MLLWTPNSRTKQKKRCYDSEHIQKYMEMLLFVILFLDLDLKSVSILLWFPTGPGQGQCSVPPRDSDVDGGECDGAGWRSGCPRRDEHSCQLLETGNVRLTLCLVPCYGRVCNKSIIVTGDWSKIKITSCCQVQFIRSNLTHCILFDLRICTWQPDVIQPFFLSCYFISYL